MRYKVIGALCVALFVGGGIAKAQVDFGKLLGSIGFTEDDLPSLGAPADDAVPEELPAPTVIPSDDNLLQDDNLMPEDLGNQNLENETTNNGSTDPVPMELPPLTSEVDPNASLRAIPQLPARPTESIPSLDNEMADVPAPMPTQYENVHPVGEQADLQSLIMDYQPETAATAQVSHSVLEGGCDSGCASCGHGNTCGHRVARVPACLPAADLPPPASFQALYRTPACYRGLWSGYAQDKALECSHDHRHLHGTCNCARDGRANCTRCLSR